MLTGRDKRHHGFLRRVQNAAFSPASMKELDPIIHRYMSSFILCIATAAERNDGIVDMAYWFANQMFAVSPPEITEVDGRWLENWLLEVISARWMLRNRCRAKDTSFMSQY